MVIIFLCFHLFVKINFILSIFFPFYLNKLFLIYPRFLRFPFFRNNNNNNIIIIIITNVPNTIPIIPKIDKHFFCFDAGCDAGCGAGCGAGGGFDADADSDIAAPGDDLVGVLDGDAVEHGSLEVAQGQEEAGHQQCVSRAGHGQGAEHHRGCDRGPGQHHRRRAEAEHSSEIERSGRGGRFQQQQVPQPLRAVALVGFEQLHAAGQPFLEFGVQAFDQCRQFGPGDPGGDAGQDQPVSRRGDAGDRRCQCDDADGWREWYEEVQQHAGGQQRGRDQQKDPGAVQHRQPTPASAELTEGLLQGLRQGLGQGLSGAVRHGCGCVCFAAGVYQLGASRRWRIVVRASRGPCGAPTRRSSAQRSRSGRPSDSRSARPGSVRGPGWSP